ncbi:hypothetical protein [Streptacidiphilus sp. EB103A]|uniref:hypothetical protein n=1 Tax=Streptacidiphilus sp. EB103A TaxID=3156275 RepID=UPI003518384B
MGSHYTTFVLPGTAVGLDYDTPILIFGADSVQETRGLPLVTSIHRIGNEAMGYVHASPLGWAFPVTDVWANTAEEQYDHRAKVIVLREPVPAGVSTEHADLARGVLGPDLPSWLGLLLAGRLNHAGRDVPVSSGKSALSVMIDPAAPTTLPGWAHQSLTPNP